MMKRIVILLFILLLIPISATAASLVWSYGYEDWDGNIGATPGYPHMTDSYCTRHTNATEVVTSRGDVNPYAGTYMLLTNLSSSSFDPSVSGITEGNVNPLANIGRADLGCSNSSFNLDDEVSNEIFIRFRLAFTDGTYASAFSTLPQTKLLRVSTGSNCSDLMFKVNYVESSGKWWHQFAQEGSEPSGPCSGAATSGGYVGSTDWDMDDGSWHKFSLYINYTTNMMYSWYDVDVETLSNATTSWSPPQDITGSTTNGSGIVLFGNFSGEYPVDILGVAIDNIEVWDGIPDSGWDETTPISINISGSPGNAIAHGNSGGRRIVRIDNTVIALAPEVDTADHMWRSTDGGTTWAEIDDAGSNSFSGTLITGKDNYVYHFYNNGTNLYYVKFLYNGSPGSPVSIAATGASAADKSVNATVDEHGKLYVVGNWGSPDHIYMYTSDDEASTWDGPYDVSGGSPYYYAHVEVTSGGLLVCAYAEAYEDLWFAKSSDGGENWTRVEIASGATAYYNPSILTVGEDTIYVFAQGGGAGLVFTKSVNQGVDWSAWATIEETISAGYYADPSPALGSDGTIYVAYRNDSVAGSGDWREHLAASDDGGSTWSVVDDYDDAEDRMGTRSQIRYQTWYNYGGLLEWIWMQGDPYGTQNEIYYDSNSNVLIMNGVSEPGGTSISAPKNFRGVLQ